MRAPVQNGGRASCRSGDEHRITQGSGLKAGAGGGARCTAGPIRGTLRSTKRNSSRGVEACTMRSGTRRQSSRPCRQGQSRKSGSLAQPSGGMRESTAGAKSIPAHQQSSTSTTARRLWAVGAAGQGLAGCRHGPGGRRPATDWWHGLLPAPRPPPARQACRLWWKPPAGRYGGGGTRDKVAARRHRASNTSVPVSAMAPAQWVIPAATDVEQIVLPAPANLPAGSAQIARRQAAATALLPAALATGPRPVTPFIQPGGQRSGKGCLPDGQDLGVLALIRQQSARACACLILRARLPAMACAMGGRAAQAASHGLLLDISRTPSSSGAGRAGSGGGFGASRLGPGAQVFGHISLPAGPAATRWRADRGAGGGGKGSPAWRGSRCRLLAAPPLPAVPWPGCVVLGLPDAGAATYRE